MFSKNVGGLDRVIRIGLGLFILSLVWWGPQSYVGFIGVIPLLTAFIGFCPLYTVLGVSSCPLKDPK